MADGALPGWYPDPTQPGSELWWDGYKWCMDQRRPIGAPDPVDVASPLASAELTLSPASPAVDLHLLHKRAQQLLSENRRPGEAVSVLIRSANKRGAIIGTNQRVFVFKTGSAAGAAFAHRWTTYEYAALNGVEFQTGIVKGAVILLASGELPVHAGWDVKDPNSAFKARNAIVVPRAHYEETRLAVTALQSLIDLHKNRASNTSSAGSASGLAAELTKLKELHETGALTDAEFAVAKERALQH